MSFGLTDLQAGLRVELPFIATVSLDVIILTYFLVESLLDFGVGHQVHNRP